MYLHEFVISNYLCHRTTTVSLKPLTVLVGPCGGGKSAFFDALINFSMLARGQIREAFSPGPYSYSHTRFHGGTHDDRIGYRVSVSEHAESTPLVEYEIDYEQERGGTVDDAAFRILTERLTQVSPHKVLFNRSPRQAPGLQGIERFLEADRGVLAAIRRAQAMDQATPVDPFLANLASSISRFAKTRLEPFELRQPSYLHDPTTDKPFLGFRGEGLASLLYHWHEANPALLEQVQDEIKSTIPAFGRFDFNAVGTSRIGFSIVYTDKRGTVAAAKLSDGTLIYLGLVALLRNPARPPVLCIEEPENGLNPPTIRAIYALMKEVSSEAPVEQRCQIIFSSHSPLVLCEVWNGQDRDFLHQVNITDGATEVVPMKELLKDYHLAQTKEGGKDHLTFKHACEILGGTR